MPILNDFGAAFQRFLRYAHHFGGVVPVWRDDVKSLHKFLVLSDHVSVKNGAFHEPFPLRCGPRACQVFSVPLQWKTRLKLHPDTTAVLSTGLLP